jgi:hypothetical protein
MKTRVAGAVHRTVTQGCGLVPVPIGTWNGHPATVQTSLATDAGAPDNSTRGTPGAPVAGAACGHDTPAPI